LALEEKKLRPCNMKFSILINSYNYAEFVSAAILSALSQEYENTEVIIYDDGSSDQSPKIIREFSSRCTVLLSKNFGASANWNQLNAIQKAFEVSSGDYICLLDADDVFMPNKIAKIKEVINSNPGVDMIQHPMLEIDATGRPSGCIRPFLVSAKPKQAIFDYGNLLFLCSQTSGLTFSRKFLETFLPIDRDEFFLVWADVRLSRLACMFGNVGTIQEPLGLYRIHEKNDSNKLGDRKVLCQAIEQQYLYFNQELKRRGLTELVVPRPVIDAEIGMFRRALWFLSAMKPADFLRLIIYKFRLWSIKWH
jgi:glycosyltransferase involved in cell wall biosynthesis